MGYVGRPGYNVLDLPKNVWTLEKNDAWVQSGIDKSAPFMPASDPSPSTVFNATRGELSVFGRELGQLHNAGYGIQGARTGDLLWRVFSDIIGG